MKRGLIAVIAGMYCLELLGASVFAPVRVALLCSDPRNRDISAMEALLSAELVCNPRVELLERESMSLLSAEKALELSGVAGTSLSRRFIRPWLGSEVLCLLSADHQQKEIRISIIEVRTGLRLLNDYVALTETKELALQVMANAVERAIDKYLLPDEQRIYIGVLGVRNVQPAPSLDWMENELIKLLSDRLLAHPFIVVAERHQLLRTFEERLLTAPDAESFTHAALIISGRIEDVKMSAPGHALFNLQLTGISLACADAEPIHWKTEGETGNLAGIIDNVCGKIIQHAVNNRTVSRDGRGHVEAEMLIEQAFRMRLRNDKDAAALIEAAYIFQPTNMLIADLFVRTRPTPVPHTVEDAYALEYMLDHLRDAARHNLPNQRVLKYLSRVWEALAAAPAITGKLKTPISRVRRKCYEMTMIATFELEKKPPSYESTLLVLYPHSLFSRILAVIAPTIDNTAVYTDPFFDNIFPSRCDWTMPSRNRILWAYALSDNIEELMGHLETSVTPLLTKSGSFCDALSSATGCFKMTDIIGPQFSGTRISKKEIYPRWIRYLERFRDADNATTRLLAEMLITSAQGTLATDQGFEHGYLMRAMFPPPYDPREAAVNILIQDMGYPRVMPEKSHWVISQIETEWNMFFPSEACVPPSKTTDYSFVECSATNVEVSVLFDAAAWSHLWIESSSAPMDQLFRVDNWNSANNFIAIQDQDMLWIALTTSLDHQEAWLIGLDLEMQAMKVFWRYPVRDGSQVNGLALGEDAIYVALTGFGIAAFPGTDQGGMGRLEALPVLNEKDGLLSLSFGPIARVGDHLVVVTHEGPFTYPLKCESSIGIYDLQTRQLQILAASRFESTSCPFDGTGFMVSSLTPLSDRGGVVFLAQGEAIEELLYGNPNPLAGVWRLDLTTKQFHRVPLDMTAQPRNDDRQKTDPKKIILGGLSCLVEYDPVLNRAKLLSRRNNFGLFYAPGSYCLPLVPYQNAFWNAQAGKLLICPSSKDKGVFFTGDLFQKGSVEYLTGLIPTSHGIVVMGQTRIGLIKDIPPIYFELLGKR